MSWLTVILFVCVYADHGGYKHYRHSQCVSVDHGGYKHYRHSQCVSADHGGYKHYRHSQCVSECVCEGGEELACNPPVILSWGGIVSIEDLKMGQNFKNKEDNKI